MIGLELKGRLGNQMFRYAFARALSIDYPDDTPLVLGLKSFEGLEAENGWENSLKYLNIRDFSECDKKLVTLSGSPSLSLLSRIFYLLGKLSAPISRNFQLSMQSLLYGLMIPRGLFYSFDNQYDFELYRPESVYIDGSFENPKYFHKIRAILLEEFSPRFAPLQENKALYKSIESSNSVCVSIRRGDYLLAKHSSVHAVCTEEYYRRAIAWCKQNLEEPQFVFFSDDMAWVKEVFHDENALYESGLDPVWEKLRLMYSCKHFIISNSTFSWWAQYLSRNKEKKVLSPTRWYSDDRPAFLLEDSFIKL